MKENNKVFLKFIIQTTISMLSAIATALGVASCM
ncbi:smalltalk protein [Prevotella communis]|nr:smalltalk protein [Prevotella communis]UKK67002.1 smalltalk protein [Prevotella communis]UKK70859.1 smalltalk protein [Prevotella communis]